MFRRKNKNIKRAVYLGIGLSAIALEKAECFAKEYLKKENIDRKKIKSIAKKAVSELKKSKKIARIMERELKKNIDTYLPKSERRKIMRKAYKKGKKIAKSAIKLGHKKLKRHY